MEEVTTYSGGAIYLIHKRYPLYTYKGPGGPIRARPIRARPIRAQPMRAKEGPHKGLAQMNPGGPIRQGP